MLGADLPKDTLYATLSHCWGGASPIVLTQENFGRLNFDIPLEEPPETFQQAIHVARSLDIGYLWICTLCIIQDSNLDWLQEVGKMAQVYTKSFLNISADASANPYRGLFRQRDPTKWRSFFVPSPDGAKDVLGICYGEDPAKGWSLGVEESPLNRRGWVLQERMLAPRVVHFSEEQVYWECLNCMTSEHVASYVDLEDVVSYKAGLLNVTLTDSDSAADADDGDLGWDFHYNWQKLVVKYCSCELTVPSDRPFTIAGLAKAFCHYRNLKPSDYACGLWRPRFILDLAWRYSECKNKSRKEFQTSLLAISPSWSWLSVDAEDLDEEWSEISTAVAELVELKTTPIGDPFGRVSSAYVRIRAPLCQATLERDAGGVGRRTLVSIHGETLDETSANVFLECSSKGPVYLAMLSYRQGIRKGKGPSPWSWICRNADNLESEHFPVESYCCLVLAPTSTRGEFSRIGLLDVDAGSGFDKSRSVSLRIWRSLEEGFRSRDVPKDHYEAVDDNFVYTINLV